jgi:inhibitor of KinA
MRDVRFRAAGDTALVVEFGVEIDRGLSNQVLSLSERVRQARIPGVTETVPTFRSLAVHYDPLVTSAEPLVAVIREFLAGEAQPPHSARVWRVPACYEEHCAPDLADVARTKGLSISEVVWLIARFATTFTWSGSSPGIPT